MSKSKLHELSEHGQSVWLDYLSRDILENGKLAEMMDADAVVGAELAAELVRVFLGATFLAEERYIRRLKKVEEMEKANV